MTAQAFDFAVSPELQADLRKYRSAAWLLGVLGIVGLAAGWATNPVQFYRSYLWAYIFFVGISAGSLAWLMTQYLTGGAWGIVIRRPAEAAARTLPLLLVLFVPIAFGIGKLYPWANPDVVKADPVLLHKQAFLNTPVFLLVSAAILGGWSFLSWYLNRWSAKEDHDGGLVPQRKMSRLSAPGLIFWGFAVTFLSISWVMSLDAHWFSTMFGLLFVAGQGLSSLAFLITVLVCLSYRRPMSEVLTARQLHDVGKLLLANVMVWAYFSFSQWLIIWAGNLPEEIPWYLERLRGGWQYVALVIVFGHFALPFALLLSRDLKRNFKLLSAIAVFILCMRVVDVYWQVMPDASKSALALSWMDFAALIGLGGIWLGFFLMQLEKRPLMPLNAEDLVEALEHGR
ncbi:MAG TPA: hypothetical protein VG096_10295 [Bryobacteraceae bacterium]|jgi:hypothetical protein|nr:hypothetical protein [Bryobacteraceae bacterium]